MENVITENLIISPEIKPDGRDAKGRFIKGKFSGGPGRPKGGHYETQVKRWQALCKGKHLDRVYVALLNAALQGNIVAIKYYLDRTLGKCPEMTILRTITNLPSPEDLRTTLVERLAEMSRN